MGEKAEGGRSDATSQMILMPDRVLGTPHDGDHMETTRRFPTSLPVLPSPPSPAPLFPKACKLHPVQGETGAGRRGGGGGWEQPLESPWKSPRPEPAASLVAEWGFRACSLQWLPCVAQ